MDLRHLASRGAGRQAPGRGCSAYRGGMRRWRAWSLASAVAGVLTTSVYLIVIMMEGNNSVWDVFPWAMLMVVGTAASLWSALSSNASVGRSMAIGAAVVLGVIGVVAMFSVGLGLVVAAILAVVAAARAHSQPSDDSKATLPHSASA
jgi:hypothetical protein